MNGQRDVTGRAPADLRIGELAAALGLNPKTIRYYEEIGLLPAPPRTAAGYRLYGEGDAERLRFIGQAKAIGFTLEQIGEILGVRDAGRPPCEHVLSLLDRRLAEVDAQLRTLSDVRHELATLRKEAAAAPVPAGACVCGLIERHATTRGATRAR